MLLGDLIARLADESFAEETLLSFADLAALAELRAQADAEGQELGAHAAACATRYAAEASEAEWITLMGAMSRASDPAAVYLRRAFAHAARAGA
jgi:hypothetical protein